MQNDKENIKKLQDQAKKSLQKKKDEMKQVQVKKKEPTLTQNIASLLFSSTYSNEDQNDAIKEENDDPLNEEINGINGDNLS